MLLKNVGLNEFTDVLDKRLSKKPQPAGLVAKKIRKIGTPSDCTPPFNAPAWALIRDNGMCHYMEAYSFYYVLICIVGSNESNGMQGGGM